MAGIITPRSFAELELSYFEPLGVTKAEDRKNLFYLVQHVKREIANGEIAKREAKENDNNIMGDGGQQKHEDEYAADELIHSPTNSRTRVNDYINKGMDNNNIGTYNKSNNNYYNEGGGGGDNIMMSTVVHNNLMEPISPVTISSPIASVGGEDHHHHVVVRHGINNGRGAVKKLALGGVVGGGKLEENSSSNKQHHVPLSTERSSKPTPREILERELELRRLNRQEQRLLEKGGPGQKNNNNDINSDYDQEEEKREKKQKSRTKRRQSFLPSVSGNSRSSSTRRSSIATSSYRPIASSVASSVVKNDELDELGSLLDDDDEEKKSSDVDSYNNFDYDNDSRITTPKTVASVDVRSRRSSIHHRQTVKKTNATRGGGGEVQRVKNRRYSNIPRAAPLLNDDDDESYLMSDTSDLSTSVSSFRSNSTRRSSIASMSTIGTTYSSSRSGLSGISKSRVDENSYGNVERTNRRKSLVKRPGSGNGVGGTNSSVASLRTGKKRLSTIPSSSIAPLSPLAGLSSTQLDQSMASQSMKVGTAAGSRNPRRRGSIGSGRSVSSRPGTADSSGSEKLRAINKLTKVKPAGGNVGSPNSTTTASISSSYRERPSSRSSMDGSQKQQLLRSGNKKQLNVSSSSNKTNTSSVKLRQRVKSPAPRSNNPRSRSKSPLPPSSRGSARTQPSRSPLSSRGGMSPRRNQSPTPRNRAVSPMRSHRPPTSPKSLGVVGNRPLSPIRSPTRGRATSPKSPRRVKSPVGNGAVFVHGAVADNSWGTQIGQLRENFDAEHAEHMTTRQPEEEDDEYEMRIRVIVRKRPMSKKEASDGGEVDVIHPLDYDDYGRILVHQPKTKLDLTKEVETTSFAFDNVFDEHSNNIQIYERAVQGLIPGVFRGKWASVFAYGQTGSGKTLLVGGFFVDVSLFI